jgi:TRAP-type mannitol/chloroaromatic compound transport system permease small subunit
MERFLRIIERVSEWQGKIFSVLLIVATVQICYELTRRYFFNAPTDWGLELTIFFCGTTYVMSGAYAYLNDAHIRVDILYLRWDTRTKAWVDLFFTDVVLFIFCGVLVWQSGMWAWDAIVSGTTTGSVWDPPEWPMRTMLFTGSLTLLLQGFVKFVRDLQTVLAERKQP